jgi:hypothetical protein
LTLEDLIALAIAPFFYVAIVWILPKWWRNERGLHTETPPPSWPWSLAFWHALCRVWTPLAFTFLIGIPPAILTEFVTEGPLFAACNILLALAGAMLVVVCPVVMLYNRPAFLLAPHHRALPGWLAERRGAPVPHVPEPIKPPRWHFAAR